MGDYRGLDMNINVVGFCRFSFFGPSDTKLSYDDLDAAFAELYDPKRMNTRFRLFETLLLPSMAAQTNKDFTLHVMTSDVMPSAYKERLLDICEPYENIVVHLCKGTNLNREIKPLLRAAVEGADKVAQFRIDDDDALSVNYIDRLHHWAKMITEPVILTMPKGVMLFDRDNETKCRPFRRSLTAVGFAFLTPGAPGKNVFQFAHIKAGKRYTVLSDPSIFSHIQTFTATADTKRRASNRLDQFTNQFAKNVPKEKLDEMVTESIKTEFPFVTLDEMHALQAEVNIAPASKPAPKKASSVKKKVIA